MREREWLVREWEEGRVCCVAVKISNIESNRVGICLEHTGVTQDNYLDTGGIMESRQDFNQFHILHINE